MTRGPRRDLENPLPLRRDVRSRWGGKRALIAGALAGALLAGGTTFALSSGGGEEGMPTITLTARLSKFNPDRIAVERGTTVRFVVRNEDPIGHEIIIGGPEVHQRHEKGTEAYHPPIPGEASVAAYEEVETTFTFDEPGVVQFGCHLPGHWTYGMHGEIEVS